MLNKECIICGDEITGTPAQLRNKPGKINECWECGEESEEGMVKLGGNMIYYHKTAAEIEIKPFKDAKEFSRRSDRVGGQGIVRNMAETR